MASRPSISPWNIEAEPDPRANLTNSSLPLDVV